MSHSLHANNVILVSSVQTASLLTFSMYALIMYPEVTEKLRVEIDSRIGRDGYPTLAKLQSMTYRECNQLFTNFC